MTDLHNKALLPRSLQISFHSIMRGLSACAPRMWYASRFAKRRGRYPPFRAKSKIIYKVVNWHSLPPLRRETEAAGPSFPAVSTERVGHFGGGCEILEYAPGFRHYSSFCQCFQEKVAESLNGSLSPSPPLTEHSSLYANQIPVLSMWFLQARCGLLF